MAQAAIAKLQQFSSETEPTVWKILPLFEDLMDEWKQFVADREYSSLHDPVKAGLVTVDKYFDKGTLSTAQVVNMCMSCQFN